MDYYNYHITGKCGDGFNLANWPVCRKSPNLIKLAKHCANALYAMQSVSVVTKPKTRQYVQKADSPSLKFTKFPVVWYNTF